MSTDPSVLSRWAAKIHRALTRPAYDPTNSLIDELHRLRCRAEALPPLSSLLRACRARHWSHAADQVRRQIGSGLRELQYALSHCERAVVTTAPHPPSMRLVFDELRQLFDEFDDCTLDLRSGILSVVTNPICLEAVALGSFRIEIELGQLDVHDPVRWLRVIALEPNPATCDETVTHPHVRDERLCTGDATTAISSALREGRICDVLMMVRSILSTYNDNSPYVRLDHWDGRACNDCGSLVDPEYSFYCEQCENDYCEDCAGYCRRCDESHCRGCLSECAICCDACCGGCLSNCKRCRAAVCPDCLDEETCHACLNGENEEPESDETPLKPVGQKGQSQSGEDHEPRENEDQSTTADPLISSPQAA